MERTIDVPFILIDNVDAILLIRVNPIMKLMELKLQRLIQY